jgi:two-component system, cell cycle sensor histidine kinase and response regulator CckA
VEESRSLFRRLIGEDICLTVTPSHGLSRVRVDPGQINQVLMNLVLNARDAMPQGGKLTIATREVDFAAGTQTDHPEMRPGRYVVLAVVDTGCGIAPEIQPRIFEPFFSTKSDNTGLGLSVVDGIVKQKGGIPGRHKSSRPRHDVQYLLARRGRDSRGNSAETPLWAGDRQ